MRTSEQINELVAALSKARLEFPTIERSKKVEVRTDRGRYDFWYAPLEDILKAVADPLAEEGLVLVGGLDYTDDGALVVKTRLAHASGQWIESGMNVGRLVDDRVKVRLQEMGSAITYGRRYGICAILGIQADDDDDGNAAEGNTVIKSETKPFRVASVELNGISQDPSPNDFNQDPAHPTQDQVNDLVSLGITAYGDLALFSRAIRITMNLPGETKITKKFLRESMSMEQYLDAYEACQDVIKKHVEKDVPDYPTSESVGGSEPDNTSSAQDHPPATTGRQEVANGTSAPGSTDTGTSRDPSDDDKGWTVSNAIGLHRRAQRAGLDDIQWKRLQNGYYLDAIDTVEAAEKSRGRQV